jgi:hypothetical protein
VGVGVGVGVGSAKVAPDGEDAPPAPTGAEDPAVEGPVGAAVPVDPDDGAAAASVGFFGAQGFSLLLILSSFPFPYATEVTLRT